MLCKWENLKNWQCIKYLFSPLDTALVGFARKKGLMSVVQFRIMLLYSAIIIIESCVLLAYQRQHFA